jgi:hypothetical protein
LSAPVTREALLVAAREALGPGLAADLAVVVGYSRLIGEPLDPHRYDDAALLLRARRLLDEGLSVAEALETARAELATWSVGR